MPIKIKISRHDERGSSACVQKGIDDEQGRDFFTNFWVGTSHHYTEQNKNKKRENKFFHASCHKSAPFSELN
jgi:hypothetical protein